LDLAKFSGGTNSGRNFIITKLAKT